MAYALRCGPVLLKLHEALHFPGNSSQSIFACGVVGCVFTLLLLRIFSLVV